jgi:choline monooxygenase
VSTAVFGRNEPAPQHLHRGFLAAVAEAGSAHRD